MKKLRKLSALLIAAVIVFAMAMPVAAADATKTSEDKGTIEVSGLQAGDIVNAYKIVGADYDETTGLFKGYEVVEGYTVTATDFIPNADEIATNATVARGKTASDKSATVEEGATSVSLADLPIGVYLILVQSADTDVVLYNPMIASIGYVTEDIMKDGEKIGIKDTIQENGISASEDYMIGSTKVYAKASGVETSKEITKNSMNDSAIDESNKHGDDHKVGDVVTFKAKTTIPSYSKDYKDLMFEVSDEMTVGLKYLRDLKVTVGDTEYTHDQLVAGEVFKADIAETDRGYSFAFTDAFIRANGEKNVELVYSAEITNEATVNFDANTNTVKVKFSNNPADKDSYEEQEDKTYHYTFSIDGNVNGSKEKENWKNHELIKIDENGDVTVLNQTDWEKTTSETTIEPGLAGATFTLTQTKDRNGNDVENGKVWTATTDGNGYFNGFDKLDAGTYTLVETVPPTGYSLDTTEHTVVISDTYNNDGTLASYTITIDDENTSTYNATYNSETKEITKITVESDETTWIKNTRIPSLPSTGGMGTYIFTILGVALIGVAASLLIFKRRKDA